MNAKFEIEIETGDRMVILNKFGDEIADSQVTEIDKDGFSLSSGDAVLFRQIASFDGNTLKLNVAF